MTGGVLSVQQADDAFCSEEMSPLSVGAGASEAGLNAAAAENQFEQSQLKTHELQAVLARAAEAGEFGGAASVPSVQDSALLSVLAKLESAKDRLDRIRLRG